MDERRSTLKPAKHSLPKISQFIFMGDSLSDTGTMYNRELLGCIPMRYLTGLAGRSPQGSFTNGYTWPDLLCAMLASEFIIQDLKEKEGFDPVDIADAILHGDPEIMKIIDDAYSLDNDKTTPFNKNQFIRSYCEGGLSAHDYRGKLSSSATLFFRRLIVATLEEKRKDLLLDDQIQNISQKTKAETLVIEWSGANDVATVNKEPTLKEADKAIAARINNVELLIAQGYRHFVLLNLPDLSLTPRFQKLNLVKRLGAKSCAAYFNQELAKIVRLLESKYPECSISIFNINEIMLDAYTHPEKYGLDNNKLRIPYTESSDFKMQKNGTSPAAGYMFWDDVHPTADVHAFLATRFYFKYKMLYKFMAPGEWVIARKDIVESPAAQPHP